MMTLMRVAIIMILTLFCDCLLTDKLVAVCTTFTSQQPNSILSNQFK